jgi:hypothetical protein
VATQNNKPDLADLKARLGLKPGAKEAAAPAGPPAGVTPGAPPPGIASSGPPGAQRPSSPVPGPVSGPAQQAAQLAAQQAAAQQASAQLAAQQAAAQQASAQPAAQQAPAQPAARQAAQVPSFAAAPPPAAARPPAAALKPKPAPVAEAPIVDGGPDIPMNKARTFDGKTVALLAVMVVVGLVFGYAGSQTMHFRKLSEDRKRDALKVHDAIKRPIENISKELVPAIVNLDSSKPDYEAAAKLAQLDFVPDAGSLGGNQILIGSNNVYNITQTMGKAMALRELLKQHDYLTNKVDKAELEQLMSDNAVLQTEDKFAIIFNYKSIIEALGKTKGDPKAAAKGYLPPTGRLVTFGKQDVNEEGDIKVKLPGNGGEMLSPIFGVIVLDKNEMLKSGGQNALTRYSQRVKTLKFYANDLANTSNGLLDGLKQIADGAAPAAPAEAPKEGEGAK